MAATAGPSKLRVTGGEVGDSGESRNFTSSGLILLIAVTLWTFWGSLRGPFHFDDNLFLQSPQVTEPGDPLYLLKPTQSRQLTYLTFYWNYRLGTTAPFGYHLVNLLVHVANMLAVFWVAGLLMARKPDLFDPMKRRWLPLAAAGIFALHPVQSEAVNYVYQRSTLLAALFALLCMGCFLQSRTSKHRKGWLALSGASFCLAVASKEMALVLPLLWVAFAWTESVDFKAFRRFLAGSVWLPVVLALSGLGALFALYNLWSHGERTTGLALIESSRVYFLAQIQVLMAYLRLMLWPAGLSVDHDFHPAPATTPYALACMLALAALVLLAAFLRRRNSTLSFLLAAFLIFLLPTSSVVPSKDLLFEHRLYLPMIPAAIVMAWAILAAVKHFLLPGRRRTTVALICVCSLLGGYAHASRVRTFIWGDDVRLWQDAVSKAPLKARVHYNLAIAWLDRDRQAAELEFLKTLELDPRYAAALYNLGWLAQLGGSYDQARNYYLEAIQTDPATWQAYHNLGNIDVLEGNYQKAIPEFEETIRHNKTYAPAYLNLAVMQLQTGNAEAALQTLRNLETFRWDLLEARYLAAYVLVQQAKFGEAEDEIAFLAAHDLKGDYSSRIAELRSRFPPRLNSPR